MSRPLRLFASQAADRACAVELLQAGALVALPTETVYGLAGRCDRPQTVARVYDVKSRPLGRALPLLVASFDEGERYWKRGAWSATAQALSHAFWPGPLTIIAPAAAHVSEALTSDGTIALRCPDQPDTRAILQALGVPVVCPSANRSEDPSPTSAEAVERGLGASVDALVISEYPLGGMESTIVRLGDGQVEILRPGALASAEIGAVLATLADPPTLIAPKLGPSVGASASDVTGVVYVGPSADAPADATHFEVASVDEALRRVHAFLATIPRTERATMGFELAPSLGEDPRTDALIRVLSRYLGR